MRFYVGVLLLIQLFPSIAFPQDALRIATYNLLGYPGSDPSARNPYFRTVTHTMDPDVIVVQEMESQLGVDLFLSDVMNFGQPNVYSSIPFHDGTDTDNSIFYKRAKVNFLGATYIHTALRDIAEYRFEPVGSSDSVRLYSVHLNAGDSDSIPRLGEATILRNYLNGLPAGTPFLVAGDFNIEYSNEPAFQKLVGSEANNNGRCDDPLNAIGTWNNNFAFRFIHTQSTRTRSFGHGSTGGMDDRFDMILTSLSLDSALVTSTYTAYGNDGNHFNDSINKLPNGAVPDSVANALHYASDHLPVFADVVFMNGSIPCDSIDLLQARCVSRGTLQARIVLLNSTKYAGEEVTMNIDGTDYNLTVVTNGVHSKAQVQLTRQVLGEHTIALTNPGGCFDPMVVTCAGSLAKDDEDWIWDEIVPGVGSDGGSRSPSQTMLFKNFPDPFNPSTTIRYALGGDSRVTIRIYNVLGQLVATLVDEVQSAGFKEVIWSGTNDVGAQVTSGVYIYRLSAGRFVQTRRMLLLR